MFFPDPPSANVPTVTLVSTVRRTASLPSPAHVLPVFSAVVNPLCSTLSTKHSVISVLQGTTALQVPVLPYPALPVITTRPEVWLSPIVSLVPQANTALVLACLRSPVIVLLVIFVH